MTPGLNPPIKSFTYQWVEESPQNSNLQTELNYMDWTKAYSIVTNLVVPQWGLWVELGTDVSTNHKSENRIELSQLGCNLLNF